MHVTGVLNVKVAIILAYPMQSKATQYPIEKMATIQRAETENAIKNITFKGGICHRDDRKGTLGAHALQPPSPPTELHCASSFHFVLYLESS